LFLLFPSLVLKARTASQGMGYLLGWVAAAPRLVRYRSCPNFRAHVPASLSDCTFTTTFKPVSTTSEPVFTTTSKPVSHLRARLHHRLRARLHHHLQTRLHHLRARLHHHLRARLQPSLQPRLQLQVKPHPQALPRCPPFVIQEIVLQQMVYTFH
ncbi:hypothetical protein CYMTET_11332, partial [Cymbomonas tetramitiformis]